jgi:hypothetical protein
VAKKTSRKRRKERQRAARPEPAVPPEAAATMERGYARSRARDDAIRASLQPLRPGERPGAVTVGAIAAALLAVAQVIALIVSYDSSKPREVLAAVFGIVIMTVVAVGMWRARYYAVLGMQALLALTIVAACLALIGVDDVLHALIAAAIIGAAGTLFWFLVKAMARIQMPVRPGR